MADDDDKIDGSAPSKLDGEKLREKGQKWLDRIKASQKREDHWLKDAHEATLVYTGEGEKRSPFNILFSNVETIVPSIYNSTPSPDVRRRFSDPDPVSKQVATVLERSISIQLDNGALDGEVEAVAQDAFISGRGIIRIRALEPGKVEYESVPWRDYTEGPAKRWRDVPWVAFKHALADDEYDKIKDESYVTAQSLDGGEKMEGEPKDDEVVWEIWCKSTKSVKFVRDRDAMLLKEQDDPLGLSGFFPMPEPVQPITISGRRMPVNPYSIYRELAEELNRLTRRINKIAEGMKVRGAVVSGEGAADIKELADAGDNELVELRGVEIATQAGGLDKLISWWPIEQAARVLTELMKQREQTKQAIYEITGISDIVRGASRAAETATAQQIKTQWGSLRIKKMQRMIESTVRDLFQMTADIIARTTDAPKLQEMTGVGITPEMAAMLEKPVLRSYRIDVESDSTVRADVGRNQEQMNLFLMGSAQFMQAIGPAVKEGAIPKKTALEIYSAFARSFKLGRQAEDELDGLAARVDEEEKQKNSQPKEPTPDQIKAEGEKAKLSADAAMLAAKTPVEMEKLAIERKGLEVRRLEIQLEFAKLQAQVAASIANIPGSPMPAEGAMQ